MRRKRNVAAIVLVVVIVICVVGFVAWACSGATRKPGGAPPVKPVSVVEPWCVDPVAMVLLDDDWCERDDDHDGVVDGHWYVPLPGLVKPARGGKLPPQVKLGSPNHVLRIPVKTVGPSKTVQPALPAPVTPKRTSTRKSG